MYGDRSFTPASGWLGRKRREARFWRDAVAWREAVTPLVLPRALTFAAVALVVGLAHEARPWPGLDAAPVSFTGVFLGVLLVFRTNAGYDRWWEARELWGGIVNQSRNLAASALIYGPADPAFRDPVLRWCAAFGHVTRRSLRGERDMPEVTALIGDAAARDLQASAHMPSLVALRIGALLRGALHAGTLHPMGFLAVDEERRRLIDHVGGCERILKTPLPLIHSIKLRRFIVLYLLGLPFAIVSAHFWLPALITLLVAYPLLGLDQIALELENPFSPRNLSHLPLDDITATIERNVTALPAEAHAEA